MKNLIKYGFIALVICFFTACTSTSEMEYNSKYWQYKTKHLELDYILKVQKVKKDMTNKEKIRQLDSLINCI